MGANPMRHGCVHEALGKLPEVVAPADRHMASGYIQRRQRELPKVAIPQPDFVRHGPPRFGAKTKAAGAQAGVVAKTFFRQNLERP